MTSIVDLPTEILLIIIDYLDATSLNRLYAACDRIRDIIKANAVLKQCDLSVGKISKAQTLKSIFFKDVSRNIQELNLRGVKGLNKNLITSAAKKLNNLKSLNISYTNISILDFIEIYQVCQSIKNITINFAFTSTVNIPKNTLIQCQKVFENIESVHFIGNICNLLYSRLPLFILNKAKLRSLQYTVSDYVAVTVYRSEEWENTVNFEEFIFNGNHKDDSSIWSDVVFLSKLSLEDYEAIFIYKFSNPREISFAVTPILSQFIKEHFACYKSYCISDRIVMVEYIKSSCLNIMLWRTNLIQFDRHFFKRLFLRIKSILPWCFEPKSNVPLDHSWFSLSLNQVPQVVSSDSSEAGMFIKRQRIAQPNYVLNYDEEFDKNKRIELSINFNRNITGVSLSANCNYLRKLTSLFLCGSVRYSGDFFNILFRCCTQLVTFSIESFAQSASIAKSLPLSQTLKNISIVDKDIDFVLLFSCMSQCRTLEIVNIYDTSYANKFADPIVMFKNCKNMYCLVVNGSMTGPVKNLNMLAHACRVSRFMHLKTNLFDRSKYHIPCLDVFKCCY